MSSPYSMPDQSRKPILRGGVLPVDPTPLETHAHFALEMDAFFKDSGAKTTYCIVRIYTTVDTDGKIVGTYAEGVGTIRASSRTLAEHTAHTIYVHGANVSVKAMTAGEAHAERRDYLLMQSLRGRVWDADTLFESIKERYVFAGVEMGPIPGTPDTFPSAVGKVFYSGKDGAAHAGGNGSQGDGGSRPAPRTAPKPRRPPG